MRIFFNHIIMTQEEFQEKFSEEQRVSRIFGKLLFETEQKILRKFNEGKNYPTNDNEIKCRCGYVSNILSNKYCGNCGAMLRSDDLSKLISQEELKKRLDAVEELMKEDYNKAIGID